MNKSPCLYVIARFAPFVETGEFANVGIVMLAPEQRFFGSKLLFKRHARVTRFFEQMEPQVFRGAMRALRDELARAAELLKQHGFDGRDMAGDAHFAKSVFAEIVRPRETVVKFSEPRVVLAEAPQATLAELYDFYVERSFVTREYQETVLEKGVRKWLDQARIADRFMRLDVGNDEYHVAFPFVEKRDGCLVKAIKPLHLAQDQPTKIIEHGAQWQIRVEQLRKRQQLPEKVLFAVQGPTGDGVREKVYEETVASLRETGVTVLPYTDRQHILEFAAATI